jgi:two-component system KDP operon response regulator KdpE
MAADPHSSLVLLVEDDAWIRCFIRDVLSDEGYDVVEAADGRTGLRLATERCPDLVLLDLAMPDVTGMDVLHNLKRAQATQGVPVLVLSAFTRVLPERDAASVAGVLAKPVDVSKLLEAIEDALSSEGPAGSTVADAQLAE